MNTLRKHKYVILLAALIWVALVESFSHRQLLGPVLSDVAITMMLLLVFLAVAVLGDSYCDESVSRCFAVAPLCK